MAKRRSARRTTGAVTSSHTHRAGRCLAILRQLSAFIDDELPVDICGEIQRHLGACPHCEEFVESLRQTVALCRYQPAPQLSSADRSRLRAIIMTKARARS